MLLCVYPRGRLDAQKLRTNSCANPKGSPKDPGLRKYIGSDMGGRESFWRFKVQGSGFKRSDLSLSVRFACVEVTMDRSAKIFYNRS